MKKTLSIVALALVAVLMMTSLVACGGSSTKVAAGSYKLTEASGEGSETYDSMKDSLTLEVEDGGKASLQFAGISALELTFNEESGKVSLDGQEVPYKVEGNKITIEDSQGKLVFEKK